MGFERSKEQLAAERESLDEVLSMLSKIDAKGLKCIPAKKLYKMEPMLLDSLIRGINYLCKIDGYVDYFLISPAGMMVQVGARGEFISNDFDADSVAGLDREFYIVYDDARMGE